MGDLSGQPVVELKNLKKSYGERRVLNGFDLSIRQGEFVAITGGSGSGKSTLLNIIGLLEEAEPGSTVCLFGKIATPIKSRKARALLRRKIAYVFQNAALVEQDSVRANLKIAQRYSRKPKKDWQSQRKEALSSVGLNSVENSKVYHLSGGEQQRLAVACIQLHPSDLILADEPTGSLDATNRDVILDLLCRFHKQGKTLVVVTHDDTVAERADRIFRLNG